MKWIRTSEMIEEIKANKNVLLDFEHWLGGPLVRTHYFYYDANSNVLYEETDDLDKEPITFEELSNTYQNQWWRRYCWQGKPPHNKSASGISSTGTEAISSLE